MVQVVVAQKEACIDGLGQQGIDGNHDQEHSQLKDRVESEENRTGHHGQHPLGISSQLLQQSAATAPYLG